MPPKKKKFTDPGKIGVPLQNLAPKPFTPAFQSIPGQTPAIPVPKQTIKAPPSVAQPQLSAVSGTPLSPTRITKFFLSKGEVTEQEFRRAKEEAKIISEGGRRVVQQSEIEQARAEISGQISPVAEAVTGEPAPPTEEEQFAAGREFASQTIGVLGIVAALKSAFAQAILGRTLSKAVLKSAGLSLGVPILAQRQKVKEAANEFDNSRQNIEDAINEQSFDLQTKLVLIQEHMRNINMQERALKIYSSDPILAAAGTPGEELADIINFRENILPGLLRNLQAQEELKRIGAGPLGQEQERIRQGLQ